MALADLPQELADGEDLLHAGRGVGHEVEGAGQRPDLGDQGDALAEVGLEAIGALAEQAPQAVGGRVGVGDGRGRKLNEGDQTYRH